MTWHKRHGWTGPYLPNPWGGEVVCPCCGSDEWTMPRYGFATPGVWRCVWPCHVWLSVKWNRGRFRATLLAPATQRPPGRGRAGITGLAGATHE